MTLSAKLFLFCSILLIITGFYAFEECVYLVAGREATAKVTGASVVTTLRRSGTHKHLKVEFAFVEPNGTQRTGSDTASADWIPPGEVAIRYTPGKDGRSRLAGTSNWLLVGLFFVSLAVVAGFAVRLWLEAREATREPERRPRRGDRPQPRRRKVRPKDSD
jgi:hypothetical protein